MRTILVINLLVLMLNNFIHPITPELLDVKHAPAYLNGILYASMALASFICSPIWGKMMNKIGIKLFLMIGPTGYGFVQLGFYFFNTPILIMASRFCAGVFASMFIVGISSYVAKYSQASKRSYNFGLIAATTSLGAIGGQLLSGQMAKVGLWLPFMALCLGSILVSILIFFIIKLPQISSEEEAKVVSSNFSNVIKILRENNQLRYLLIFILMTFSAYIFNANLGFNAKQTFYLTPKNVSIVITVSNATILFLNLVILRWLENNVSLIISLLAMLACGIVSSLWLYNCFNFPLFLILVAIFVCSYALYRPILQNELLIHLTDQAPILMGGLNSINSLAMVSGGVISGLVFGIKPQLMFMIIFGLLVTSLVLLIVGSKDGH